LHKNSIFAEGAHFSSGVQIGVSAPETKVRILRIFPAFQHFLCKAFNTCEEFFVYFLESLMRCKFGNTVINSGKYGTNGTRDKTTQVSRKKPLARALQTAGDTFPSTLETVSALVF
jgi:hypothetical protein